MLSTQDDNRCDGDHSPKPRVVCIDMRYMYTKSGTTVTTSQTVPWLLLVFSLPARSASQRVQIW